MGVFCVRKEICGLEFEVVFLKEVSILVYLKYFCIVNFICCGNGLRRGDYFIVMEFMEMSFFDLIKD